MAHVAPPRPVIRTEPAAPTVFWKDLSVIGCVVSGLLLGVMVFALLDPSSGIPKVREVMRFQTRLESDIEQIRAENAAVLNAIQAMQTDPFWQEKIAREELNMARPGEIVYKFTE